MNLSVSEKVDMVFCLGKADKNSLLAARIYHQQFPHRRQPKRQAFERVKREFISKGSVNSYPKNRRPVIAVTDEGTQLNILLSLEENPHTSTRELENETGIPKTTINRIARKYKYHPYHMNTHQNLTEHDFETRLFFCRTMLNRIHMDNEFVTNILFTDEATFRSTGIGNRHNMHYYNVRNPHWLRKIDNQNRWSLNVWGGIIGDYVIGPYFLDGTLTGERYELFLRNELGSLLDDVDLYSRQQLWFQHDGAPSHSSISVRNYLNQRFPRRWIGRGGQIIWPPRSPDLTPLDFFLWGYVKDMVYKEPVTTSEDMRRRILDAFGSITVPMLIEARQSFVKRLQLCIRYEGNIFEHL